MKVIDISADKSEMVEVVIGTPIHRTGAFVLDKFLLNQKEIQDKCPSSELVLATAENDFAGELETLLASSGLRGKVLRYETVKPADARNRIWNITCGREALRQYTLSQTGARYMLFLDADMTCDPNIVEIMKREIRNCDVVYSGCPLRGVGIALAGTGCCMITADTLREVKFKCIEFSNGHIMSEDQLLEFDLIKSGKRVKKGFFLTINHYVNAERAKSIEPRPVGLYRRITHFKYVRCAIARTSIALHYDIGLWLLNLNWKLGRLMKSILCFRRVNRH
ncbi:MAG: glycosyltransferase family 2 protein [Dehalococcoidia bacterium]|nr:glycosyltransferase family 2 protein [Dehalococcoidia bacterium]